MLRIYEGYVTSFDLRTRNPKWVLEFISSETLKGEGTRYEERGVLIEAYAEGRGLSGGVGGNMRRVRASVA
jgi:hypothetical protein